MLVNRKQHIDVYEEQLAPTIVKSLPKLNIELRGKCLFTVLLIAAIAIFITMRSEAIIRSGYELVQMKSQALSLQRENELLRLDIAKLKSPQRIQAIATIELGMVMPQTVYCADSAGQSVEVTREKEKTMVSVSKNQSFQ